MSVYGLSTLESALGVLGLFLVAMLGEEFPGLQPTGFFHMLISPSSPILPPVAVTEDLTPYSSLGGL